MYTIRDPDGKVVAEFEAEEIRPGRFEGKVLRSDFPDALHALLREYEGLVNDLVLSCLDDVQENINQYQLFLHERNARIHDLSLWNDNDIQFSLEGYAPPSYLPADSFAP